MSEFLLKIITPERVLYDGMVKQVSLPAYDGEITVLPNHSQLLSLLKSGEVCLVDMNFKSIPLSISGGFVEIESKRALILVDNAEHVHEIDEERARLAKERAIERLAEKQLDSKEYAYLISKIDKEFARIRVARKYRG